MQCMGMAGLTVDKGNMVFSTNAEDSRDRRCIVRMVAEVNGDAEQYLTRVAEGLLPHGMALPFSLPQIGGFSFGPGAGKKVNITRLPWGGARSKVAAYVRGADLLSNHHNTSRNKQETDGSRHNTDTWCENLSLRLRFLESPSNSAAIKTKNQPNRSKGTKVMVV